MSEHFPSCGWFQAAAEIMKQDRQRQELLGYIDCVVDFKIVGENGQLIDRIRVVFEEYDAVEIKSVDDVSSDEVDFVLEASLETWKAMIESIKAGEGQPDLTQSLNYLSHLGTPLALKADDPLRRDMYFRFNQSLQEFFNASAGFETRF